MITVCSVFFKKRFATGLNSCSEAYWDYNDAARPMYFSNDVCQISTLLIGRDKYTYVCVSSHFTTIINNKCVAEKKRGGGVKSILIIE